MLTIKKRAKRQNMISKKRGFQLKGGGEYDEEIFEDMIFGHTIYIIKKSIKQPEGNSISLKNFLEYKEGNDEFDDTLGQVTKRGITVFLFYKQSPIMSYADNKLVELLTRYLNDIKYKSTAKAFVPIMFQELERFNNMDSIHMIIEELEKKAPEPKPEFQEPEYTPTSTASFGKHVVTQPNPFTPTMSVPPPPAKVNYSVAYDNYKKNNEYNNFKQLAKNLFDEMHNKKCLFLPSEYVLQYLQQPPKIKEAINLYCANFYGIQEPLNALNPESNTFQTFLTKVNPNTYPAEFATTITQAEARREYERDATVANKKKLFDEMKANKCLFSPGDYVAQYLNLPKSIKDKIDKKCNILYGLEKPLSSLMGSPGKATPFTEYTDKLSFTRPLTIR